MNATHTFNNLTFGHKDEYYVTVRVTNTVALSTEQTSNGVMIDLTAPEPIEHRHGNSSNSNGICNAALETCNEETSSGNSSHSHLKI